MTIVSDRRTVRRLAERTERERGYRLIGKRVEVRYNDGIWYAGKIRQYNSRRGLHVVFDDGDKLWTKDAKVDLTPVNCRIVGVTGKKATAEMLLPSPQELLSAAATAGHGDTIPAQKVITRRPGKRKVNTGTPPAPATKRPAKSNISDSNTTTTEQGAETQTPILASRKQEQSGSTDTPPSQGRESARKTTHTADAAAKASAEHVDTAEASAEAVTTAEASTEQVQNQNDATTGAIQPLQLTLPQFVTSRAADLAAAATAHATPTSPPKQLSSPLTSTISDAGIIVSHKPDDVRQAIADIQKQSVHLPVGQYLDQLITMFAVVDGVIPLYAARGQVLTFLHAVEVVANQLQLQMEVKHFAQIVALHPEAFSIRICTSTAPGIAQDRRRLRARAHSNRRNWCIEWPEADIAAAKRDKKGPDINATISRTGPAAVLKQRALRFRRAVVSWVTKIHSDFLLSKNIVVRALCC